MSTTSRLGLALPALLLAFGAASLAAQEPPPDGSLEATVDSLVASAMEGRGRVPGAAVAVVEGGRLALLKGYGVSDVASGTPVDPRGTVFHVGSLSKPITATAVLQLADAGRLDLHGDVNRHLTALRIDPPGDRPVTAADLLSHSGGFDRRILGRMTRDPSELGDLGAYLARRMPPVVRPPGVLSVYSNHGYALAGHLVEAVTGRPFAEAVEERLFVPLSMDRSSFGLRPDLEEAMATGYGWRGAEGPPEPRAYVRTVSASMLRTTAADLSRWMRAVLAGGVLDSIRVLSDDLTRRMLRRQRGNHRLLPGRTFGLSEGTRFDPPSAIHAGGVPGFTSALVLHEGLELGVLVLLNSRASPWGIVRGILGLHDGRVPAPAPPPFSGEPVPTSRLSGHYRNAEIPHHGPARIGALVEQVRIEAPEPGQILWNGRSYRAVDSLAFRREGGDEVVAFVRQDDRVRYAARAGGEYERVSGFRSRPVQAGLWLGFLLLFLVGTGAAGVWLARGRAAERPAPESGGAGPAPRWPVLIGGGAALLNVLFVGLLAVGLGRTMGGSTVLDFGLPGWLRAAFLLPPLAALLALPAAWGAFRAWRESWSSRPRRVAFTVLACGLLAFPFLLASWGLLGLAR